MLQVLFHVSNTRHTCRYAPSIPSRIPSVFQVSRPPFLHPLSDAYGKNFRYLRLDSYYELVQER